MARGFDAFVRHTLSSFADRKHGGFFARTPDS